MAQFTIRHTFDVDEATFWKECFIEEEFNQRLFEEKLKFGYEKLDHSEVEPGKWHRKVKIEPDAEAPAVVKKLIGDSVSYIEEGTFDGNRYRFTITPSKLANKIGIRGEMYCESKGEKKIDRCVAMNVEVKIFGVGGAVEKYIEKTTRDSYDRGAEFTRTYVQEKGL